MVQGPSTNGMEVICFQITYKSEWWCPKVILIRDVPSYGFYIIAYEWLFDKVCDRKKGELPSIFQTVWVGGVSG